MPDILFTALQKWTAVNSKELIDGGFTVLLDSRQNPDGVTESTLELENRRYLGRLQLKETGDAKLGAARVGSGKIRRGECQIFTDGQLEDAINQLLEWMGEIVDRDNTGPMPFSCPESKRPYTTRKEAKAHKKRSRLPDYFKEYRCQYCGLWHFSSGSKRSGEGKIHRK